MIAVKPHGGDASFVGRVESMLRLERLLDAAIDGRRPQLVLIDGSPGQGKTWLLRHFLDLVRRRGIAIGLGHGRDSRLAPYLPIIEALSVLPGGTASFDGGLPDEQVRTEFNPSADLREQRVVLGATTFVLAQSEHPFVLAIEDLHWADAETISLLGSMVASATYARDDRRLLIVATVRSSDCVGSVAREVDRLRRQIGTTVLKLEPLSETEINDLLTVLLRAAPTRRLLRDASEATGGLPIAVRLLADRLAEQGDLVESNGRMERRSAGRLPGLVDLVDETTRIRLDKVGLPCRDLLKRAALIGDNGDLTSLRVACALSSDGVADVLDEAESAGLLFVDGARYRFDHAIVARALEMALTSRERARLERDIAANLLAHYADDLSGHALDLLPVLRDNVAELSTERRLALFRAAGDQAMSRGGWASAAECYELALACCDAERVHEKAELHLLAGEGRHHDLDFERARVHLSHAVDLARRDKDVSLWADALYLFVGTYIIGNGMPPADVDDVLREYFDEAAHVDPRATARLYSTSAQLHFNRFDATRGAAASVYARELADTAGDADVASYVEVVEGFQQLARLDLAQAMTTFEGASRLAPKTSNAFYSLRTSIGLPIVDLLRGSLVAAEQRSSEAMETSLTVNLWSLHALHSAIRSGVAAIRGEFAAAEAAAAIAISGYNRSDYFFAAVLGFPQLASVYAYRGDRQQALRQLERWGDAGAGFRPRLELLIESVCGTRQRVRELAAGYGFQTLPAEASLFSLVEGALVLEISEFVADHGVLENAWNHVANASGRGVQFCPDWSLSLPRLLARGAAQLRRADTDEWFKRAQAAADAAGSSFEAARVRLDHAAHLVERGDRFSAAEAAEELDIAMAEFRRVGAIALLGRASELARRAEHGPTTRRTDVVVVYTDLVRSTDLNVRVGDELFVELRQDHDRVVRGLLQRFDGVEFTYTGDGLGAWFSRGDDALRFACAVTPALDELNSRRPEIPPLRVRVGAARGDVIDDDGNLFGTTVLRAVRICGVAQGGEVLSGNEVLDGLGEISKTEAREPVVLKGFPSTHEVVCITGL
jgi:class 3 adenylate cyclase